MRRAIGTLGVIVFFVSATLLVVSIVAPGVSAMGAFRVLPRVGVEMPAYRAYAAGSDAVMGRIAAGYALEGIFQVTTVASTALAAVAGAAWLAVLASRPALVARPRIARLAIVAVIVVVAVASSSLWEEPQLTEALDRYRAHARDGARQLADDAYGDFDRLHRRAELQRQCQAIAALLAISLAAVALAAPRTEPA